MLRWRDLFPITYPGSFGRSVYAQLMNDLHPGSGAPARIIVHNPGQRTHEWGTARRLRARPFRPEPVNHALKPYLTIVLVDHGERGPAVSGHVEHLGPVRQLLADVEVA